MPRAAVFPAVVLVCAALHAAETDPPGTVALVIEVGKTAPATEEPGANILCDDPKTVSPEYSADGNALVLRALKPGSTLCGVWLGNQKPGGLYRVQVVPVADLPDAAVPATDGGNPPQPDGGADASSG